VTTNDVGVVLTLVGIALGVPSYGADAARSIFGRRRPHPRRTAMAMLASSMLTLFGYALSTTFGDEAPIAYPVAGGMFLILLAFASAGYLVYTWDLVPRPDPHRPGRTIWIRP
jgi:hypothetical protein